ncbi:MAG: hypothetical protein MJ162_06075 [Treponema sp.]|nr:hypothetical protein [Treponema sp.]
MNKEDYKNAEYVMTVEQEKMLKAYIDGSTKNLDKTSKAYEHYKYIFMKFQNGNKISWNWYSAFFGALHLLYRKNYMWGLLIYLGLYFLSITTSGVPLIVMFIVSGMFFDYIQYTRYKDKLKEADRRFPDSFDQQLEFMSVEGGTNKIIVIIFAVITVITIAIIAAIIGVAGWLMIKAI